MNRCKHSRRSDGGFFAKSWETRSTRVMSDVMNSWIIPKMHKEIWRWQEFLPVTAGSCIQWLLLLFYLVGFLFVCFYFVFVCLFVFFLNFFTVPSETCICCGAFGAEELALTCCAWAEKLWGRFSFGSGSRAVPLLLQGHAGTCRDMREGEPTAEAELCSAPALVLTSLLLLGEANALTTSPREKGPPVPQAAPAQFTQFRDAREEVLSKDVITWAKILNQILPRLCRQCINPLH